MRLVSLHDKCGYLCAGSFSLTKIITLMLSTFDVVNQDQIFY